MKKAFAPPLIAVAVLMALTPVVAQEQPAPAPDGPVARVSDKDVALRARALEFAGALANDGFTVRDGVWFVRPSADHPRRLAVNLFAGNQYWFCATSAPDAPAPGLAVYDPEGNPVAAMTHAEPGLAGSGVTAATTGRYIVEVGGAAGSTAEFCLLYLFK